MSLPIGLDPRSFLGTESVSVSEIGALAGCEMKHHLTYGQEVRPESAKSAAMARGTEVHRLVQHWRMTGEVLPSDDDMAGWLMGRYAEHYAADDWTMGGVEIPYAVRTSPYGHLFGWFDGLLVEHAPVRAGLWLHEIKTMAQWSRLKQLPVDRQVTLYIWAARQMGLNVRGVCFDAIRTHKPVRKELPVPESFERIWIERTDAEIVEAVEEMKSALGLRAELKPNMLGLPRRPIRNVGQSCDWCPVLATCYGIDVTVLPEN